MKKFSHNTLHHCAKQEDSNSVSRHSGCHCRKKKKINLLPLLQLRPQIPVQCRKPKNDIAFLQQIDIFLHRLRIAADGLRQLIIRNLTPDLQSQRDQQLLQHDRLADSLHGKQILIHVTAGKIHQNLTGIAGMIHHIGIRTVYQA